MKVKIALDKRIKVCHLNGKSNKPDYRLVLT